MMDWSSAAASCRWSPSFSPFRGKVSTRISIRTRKISGHSSVISSRSTGEKAMDQRLAFFLAMILGADSQNTITTATISTVEATDAPGV